MQIQPGVQVLDDSQCKAIHQAILRIIAQTGLGVDHPRMLEQLKASGGHINNRGRVTFPEDLVEEELSACRDRASATPDHPQVSCRAEIYQGFFRVPETGQLEPWDRKHFLAYLSLAQKLPHVDGVSILGCPFWGPPSLQPLYERLMQWKYGLSGGGAIWDIRLAPHILKMCQIMADARGGHPRDHFRGTIYLRSPLRLGRVESEHLLFFHDRGLRVGIGHMGSLGGTNPVTLAGALALFFAERVLIHMINRALFHERTFAFGTSINVLDTRTTAFQFGRPEQMLLTLAGSHLAAFYGLPFHSHCGLSDAKAPGAEAGYQKASSALTALYSTGRGYIAAGLLGVDMIYSPLQMIFDNEFAGALKHLARGFEVNSETLALEVIDRFCEEGSFLSSPHTRDHHRNQLWEPAIWSRESVSSWLEGSRALDRDIALEQWQELAGTHHPRVKIPEATERQLKDVIEEASRTIT